MKMDIDQLGCVGVARDGELSGEALTSEVLQGINKGMEEEERVEGRQGD